MKYELTFFGRRIGAIGVSDRCVVVVEAASPVQARLKAYDTHEHIAGGVDGIAVREVPS